MFDAHQHERMFKKETIFMGKESQLKRTKQHELIGCLFSRTIHLVKVEIDKTRGVFL